MMTPFYWTHISDQYNVNGIVPQRFRADGMFHGSDGISRVIVREIVARAETYAT
jgi:hypothetical protein